jgi:hypothetical protein
MKPKHSKYIIWVRHFLLFAVLTSLLVPGGRSIGAPTIEVVVEDPVLQPPFTTCPETYWSPFANDRGHTAYLTLNTNNPIHSTNYGEWHPLIPQSGNYRVEAYIAGHAAITWCTGAGRTIEHDTSEARYAIHHAYGISTRVVSQYPLANQWLDLGEYYFTAGSAGYVALEDLNSEVEYSTLVSFSAMRFTYTGDSHPINFLPVVFHADISEGSPPEVGVLQAQGFDVCTLPSLTKMQTWWNESPYAFYGLYLGGAQLPVQCAGATIAWVNAAHQQGWSFLPTWVGPQAPCSPYSHKMSADPAVSYQQGRQEAQAASTRAAELGLTTDGLGGTIIYYDMEVFGGASLECRQAASSFMNGWVERLQELGNIAGGYGAHNSYVEDWASVTHVPNDVWAAAWYANYYDPYASVNNITWLQGMWTNHQRIRQYAGDHHETWGGIGMTIDSDVADGMVAMPPNGPRSNPTILSSLTVEDTGWLSADRGWVVSDGHLYWTPDRGKSWQDITPAPVEMAYFLPSGSAWAISVTGFEDTTIYISNDAGLNWKSQALNITPGDWWPIQMQFTSATSGWLVLQRISSQALEAASLLKTSDGGLTWQIYELPATGKITFTTPTEGWLVSSEREQVFHTQDGGHTWQSVGQNDYPQINTPLPQGSFLSGQLPSGLNWAATANGTCQGEKDTPGFTCQVQSNLWQSIDGGRAWETITLPKASTSKH